MADMTLADLSSSFSPQKKRGLSDLLSETWPAKLAQSAWGAVKLPGDVYQGNVTPNDPEYYNRATDLAGLVMGGSYAAPAMKDAAGMGIRAYHGSPHDFDRFDLSKIGTGEGAQAYGHGLYFAENPKTAETYREMLSPGQHNVLSASGEPMNWQHANAPYGQAYQILADQGSFDAARKEALRMADNLRAWGGGTIRSDMSNPSVYEKLIPVFDELEKAGVKVGGRAGHTYEVNINAEPHQFLDWDKPLSRQSQPVQSALGQFGLKADQKGMREFDDALLRALRDEGPSTLPKQPIDPTGEEIYRLKTPGFVSSGPYREPQHNRASAVLNEAGIPGIKYLDQGSRSAGEGSRNYVVFNDKIIDILKKYGVSSIAALPPAVQAMLGQQEQTQ